MWEWLENFVQVLPNRLLLTSVALMIVNQMNQSMFVIMNINQIEVCQFESCQLIEVGVTEPICY